MKYHQLQKIGFLGIEEEEVRETTKKILLLYKESINNFLDNIIAVATDKKERVRINNK